MKRGIRLNNKAGTKHTFCFPPCPVYDIEGTESWLGSMAAENGLFLRDFFMGFAVFEKGAPRSVRYRLQAASASTSMWSDSGGEPQEDAVELSRTYGWDYLCKRWQFYVYSCSNPDARELDTDSQVQALALDFVRKREHGNLISTLFWLILYSIFFLSRQLLLTAIGIRTWLFLLGTVLALWGGYSSLSSALHLRKLHRQLKSGIPLNHKKDWKHRALLYRLDLPCFLVLFGIWLGFVCYGSYQEHTGADKIPLQEYIASLPFATMEDLRPDGRFSYDDSLGISNRVKVKSDWLAPTVIELSQNGEITLPYGKILQGGITVSYYRAVSPTLASRIFEELLTRDRHTEYYEEISPSVIPPAGIEQFAVYSRIFPTLLLRKGEQVLYVSFYQTSPNYTMPLNEAVCVFADSLKG